MNYKTFFFVFVFFSVSLFGQERLVLVTVAPYVDMVQALTGPEVEVQLIVPAGYTPHTFEPTPKQILKAASAKIWFTIGELFETKAIAALQSQNPKLQIVDLRHGLSLLEEQCGHGHSHGADPHIWMSPKMMQSQVGTLATSLKNAFPELTKKIDENLATLLAKLETLDQEIRRELKDIAGDTLFVSHPAYGYFCREYNLKQSSIEFEGKDPSPKQLTHILEETKKAKVTTIFAQKQYSSKAAELVAQEIGAKVVFLDPYAQDYFPNMRHIAESFARSLAHAK